MDEQGAASPVATCITSSDGTCTLAYSGSGGHSVSATVDGGKVGGQLVIGAVSLQYLSGSSSAVGALVLDRALVKPGDALHITGKREAGGGTATLLEVLLLTYSRRALSTAPFNLMMVAFTRVVSVGVSKAPMCQAGIKHALFVCTLS
jgi:hypothetical protein